MDIIASIKSALSTASEVGDHFDNFNTRSVARGANEQSFQFPCIMDDTIPVELAATVLRNLDRVYASWTQIYLSSVGLIDLNYIRNPRQFIAKYQPKWNLESSNDDFYNECDESLRDELYGDDEIFMCSGDDCKVAALITPKNADAKTISVMRDAMRPYMEGVNRRSISGAYYEAPTANDIAGGLIQNTINDNAAKRQADQLRATSDVRGPKLSDGDVKKLNDMQPYALELKLLATKGDSSFSQWINYVIGVKTTLHPARATVLIPNIVNVLKNKNTFFNFIRWTTGEISLVKDLLLHVDDINFDIANKSDRTGKFIASLKRLKKKYVKVGTFGVNRIAPFATMVISSSTYQAIKENYGFDLKNITFASKLREELFLMCFVIIDDATHTVEMLVDGQQDFQTYALETLEREVTMNSNKLGKELTRMLGSN